MYNPFAAIGRVFLAFLATIGRLSVFTGKSLAAVVTPSATDSDALATGLLTLGAEGLPLLDKIAPKARALAAERGETTGDYEFHVRGLELG